ncbi:hypothetical protein HK099_007130 [Clydaea vesicula]|uniref:Dynein regulatory complex protein 9 n=1 Tax=Clydaea vesicula TaxID=447962 RepID=A0AAD5XYN7_9FUNG|nr:hypothetical protein HK099_007130 [Clydaea vesicula]KAJ3388446.1 hypothetical protein HDU92_001520 [Lobulomyces angularis]
MGIQTISHKQEKRLSTSLVKEQIMHMSLLLPSHKCPQYISILEDSIEQLGVLGDIEADVLKTDNRPLQGDEIARILKDQRQLETRYQDLVFDQDKLKQLPNKTKFKESKLQITDITHELSRSTQVLAKNLKSHPSVSQNLIKIQNERASLLALISKSLRELKESKFDSLSTTVEEEYRKKNTLQNTINRELEASELLKELQKELAQEKKLLEDEALERNNVIQQLKDTIQEINALTTSEQRYIKKETKAHEISVRQKCLLKEVELEKKKLIYIKKLEMEEKSHEKVVDFLTRQRNELEKQIANWMTKYDEDTEVKTNDIEIMKQKKKDTEDKLENLLTIYAELERVVEDDKMEKQKRYEEIRNLKIQVMSVIKIQRWFKRNRAKKLEQQALLKKAKKSGSDGKGKKTKKTKK